VAREVFDAHMKGPNQLGVKRDDVHVTAEDLLRVPQGTRTEAGLRHNIRVGVQYLESWLRGAGCVPLYDLMEDAATAEISRSQVWQWVKTGHFTRDEVHAEAAQVEAGDEAKELFLGLALAEELEDFLTLPAYTHLE